VSEIICGDLYDAAGGRGTFVIQRSGSDQHPSADIYIKPVANKGVRNMFVKTGDGKHTYAFDLEVGSVSQAHPIITVTDPTAPQGSLQPGATRDPSTSAGGTSETHTSQPPDSQPANSADNDRLKADILQQAHQQADEIVRGARQQADRLKAE